MGASSSPSRKREGLGVGTRSRRLLTVQYGEIIAPAANGEAARPPLGPLPLTGGEEDQSRTIR